MLSQLHWLYSIILDDAESVVIWKVAVVNLKIPSKYEYLHKEAKKKLRSQAGPKE
jgi:hypothetical protein